MRNIFYISFIVLILSCESKTKPEKPKNLIPKDQMVDLLYDMHLANGTSGIKNKKLENNLNYTALIFEKYKIDSTRFAESNLYYVNHIDDYEEIFEKVQNRIEKLKTDFDKKRDSILNRLKETKNIHKPLNSLRNDSIKTRD